MNKMILGIFLFLAQLSVAAAGGPQIKLYTEKLGSLDNTLARAEIQKEVAAGTKLGTCYVRFFNRLQERLSELKTQCLLSAAQQPMTLEITFMDGDGQSAQLRIPEFKFDKVARISYYRHEGCARTADQLVQLLFSRELPFYTNYAAWVLDGVLDSAQSGTYFEPRKCK